MCNRAARVTNSTMTRTDKQDRRAFLKTVGVAVGAAGLSGCLGGDGGSYPSRDINLTVGAGSGGSFDLNARTLAEFMPTHLPNDVNIVVENNPPPLQGITQVYNGEADGHLIGTAPILGQIARELVSDVDYEMRELTYCARIDRAEYIMAAAPEYESVQDLVDADSVLFGTPGVGTTAWLSLIIASNLLGINYSFVNFDGNAEASVALRAGDVDGMLGTWAAPPVRDPIESGEFNAVLTFTEESPSYLPDVETAVDVGQASLTNLNLMWPIFAPPGLDEDIRTTIGDAVLETVQSDEFVDAYEDRTIPFNHATGDELAQIVADSFDLFTQYEDILDEEIN